MGRKVKTQEEKYITRKLYKLSYNKRDDVKDQKRIYMIEYNKREDVILRRKINNKKSYIKRKSVKLIKPIRYKQARRKRPNRENPIHNQNIRRIGITDSYVYFIQVKGTIIYKIGITSNPLKRVEVLQTGCPFDIELKMAFITSDAVEVERKIHNDLLQFRRRGEWFNITDDHLERLKAYLQ